MAVSTEMGSVRRSCLQKSQIVKMLTAALIALRPPHCWELVSCALDLTWKLQETSCLRTFFLWLLQIEVKNSHRSVINLVVLHAKLAFTKLSNARRELQSYPCYAYTCAQNLGESWTQQLWPNQALYLFTLCIFTFYHKCIFATFSFSTFSTFSYSNDASFFFFFFSYNYKQHYCYFINKGKHKSKQE